MKGNQHDRVSDLARAGRSDRDRDVGGTFMSAEIIGRCPTRSRCGGRYHLITLLFGYSRAALRQGN